MGSKPFDGFISYSHASDDLLAPRLQAALQRFAKPWWKRRAVRIFRDQSSLSANPHLWSSITDALDASEWFVLLLSEDAARSEWVNREIAYWLTHRPANRILPVVTSGDFAWEEDDVAGSAVPEALSGAFPGEPRWVDLRWARSDTDLDLNHTRFNDSIADIASAIRGVPKDELASEEVRQHRRTIRTAWTAGVLLLLLAGAAVVGAVAAVAQSNDARAQQQRAESLAAVAEQEREAAEAAAEAEASARAEATEEADRANRVSSQLLDYFVQQVAPGIQLLRRDVQSADAPSAVPLLPGTPPQTDRLDFLFEYCDSGTCFRDARFVHPELPLDTGVWLAGRPFHIRHGFLTDAEAPLPLDGLVAGYDLRLFVTRRVGPELEDGAFPIDTTFRYHADYRVRENTERCVGSGLDGASADQVCEMFVHEFPEGLPPGRYDLILEWRAPCTAWLGEGDICFGVTLPLDLLVSQVNMAFFADEFTRQDDNPANNEEPVPSDVWDDS